MNLIEEHVEGILKKYTAGEYYELMKSAKDDYTKLTGRLDEERDEYESRMNNFNDWYIFNYRREDGRRVIDDYIQDTQVDPDLAKAFHNVTYSVFHFAKINFRKKFILKDLLHSKKYSLSKDSASVGMVVDDIFVGRVIEYRGETYLLNGICMLPRDILSLIKKQAKKVRKMGNAESEEDFLLRLEDLKTKSLNYGHIDNSKIFVFN